MVTQMLECLNDWTKAVDSRRFVDKRIFGAFYIIRFIPKFVVVFYGNQVTAGNTTANC